MSLLNVKIEIPHIFFFENIFFTKNVGMITAIFPPLRYYPLQGTLAHQKNIFYNLSTTTKEKKYLIILSFSLEMVQLRAL